jgi:hypothetical protein
VTDPTSSPPSTQPTSPSQPPPEPWVMGLTRADRTRVGRRVAFLLVTMPRWVARRVESISFHDDETVRRRVSIDLAVPRVASLRPRLGRRAELVPLAYVLKARLRNFDLRDERGAAVPALTRTENGEVAVAVLEYWANLVLGRQVEDDVMGDIEALAYVGEDEPPVMLEHLFRRDGPSPATRYLLAQDATFVGLASRLSRSFILITPLDSATPSRRVFKFAYDEMLDLGQRTPSRRLAESMSWRATRINLPVPGVLAAASYHLDVAAPAELVISRARLVTESGTALDEDPEPTRRAHLAIQLQPAEAAASIEISAPRDGIIRASLLTALLTSVVLTGGAFRLSALESVREGVATVLVSVPALIAAYLARPGEHALASRLLFGVRIAVLSSGVLSFAASGLLLVGPGGVAREATWWCLTGISWLVTALLLVSFTVPKEVRRNG